MRFRKGWLGALAIALLSPAGVRAESADSTAAPRALVLRVELDDAIGPASRSFLVNAIEQAERQRASVLVVELDTPGGLDDSMRDIIKRILAADLPVVVYVAPSGSRAASAGCFILMAAHVAAMAPGTSTGAAHPVNLGGGNVDSTMASKVENDAASFMRSLAQKHGRNVEWAESAVRQSASISAEEARTRNVIDIVADDLPALLDSLDGREVAVLSGTRRLALRGARIESVRMGWRDGVLSSIANPNVAYILLMLGTMGLVMELWNPGSIFPGVVGGISLLLAFFALQVLPVNHAGLLLLLLGVVLLVLEIKVTSYGALTIGGIAALTFGSILLFDSPGSLFRVSWSVIAPTVSLMTLFFAFVVGMGLRAQSRKPVTGREGIVGETGSADSELDPQGRVFVHGEYWNARADSRIEAGTAIEVVAVDGRTLVVRPRRRPSE